MRRVSRRHRGRRIRSVSKPISDGSSENAASFELYAANTTRNVIDVGNDHRPRVRTPDVDASGDVEARAEKNTASLSRIVACHASALSIGSVKKKNAAAPTASIHGAGMRRRSASAKREPAAASNAMWTTLWHSGTYPQTSAIDTAVQKPSERLCTTLSGYPVPRQRPLAVFDQEEKPAKINQREDDEDRHTQDRARRGSRPTADRAASSPFVRSGRLGFEFHGVPTERHPTSLATAQDTIHGSPVPRGCRCDEKNPRGVGPRGLLRVRSRRR